MPITGFDPARNFAIANLASGITNVATSITLATGKGALFPDPSADGAFNVPLYNSTDYTAPWLDPDVEIVRVTAKSTDTFTVTRAQEGTSAVAHNTGGKTYSLYMALTRKAYDDLITALIAVRGVTLGGTGAATFTDGGVLIGNGTSAVQVTSAGTAGQVLTSNGAGVDPTFQAASSGTYVPSVFPTGAAPNSGQWTDTAAYIPHTATTILTIYKYAANLTPAAKYIGTTLQTINATAIQAAATVVRGVVVVGGYVYFHFLQSTTTRWIYRADITTNIASAGNWTSITLSGANFAASNTLHMVGYGNGAFWFSDDTNNVYFPATLSGTTLTQGSTLTVTGADYENPSCVNSQGILASFSSAPFLRLADFTGALQTDKTLNNASNTLVYSVADKFFVRDSTSSTYYQSTP